MSTRGRSSSWNRGKSYIDAVKDAELRNEVQANRFRATSDFTDLSICNVIICVPTPLNKNREPDISYILNTGKNMAPHLRKGTLVVLESTTYPGTTDEDLRGVLEAGSGMKAGVGFHLAFSPEREDPGNPDSKVAVIPKVIGGYTPACLERTKALYGRAIKTLVPVSSCRVAEATKLTENIFRSVNIALVNELKVVYSAMGIDVWEVIEAAKTKPFGFMPFYPGPGLGGHCIPIDPFYLTWKAREYVQTPASSNWPVKSIRPCRVMSSAKSKQRSIGDFLSRLAGRMYLRLDQIINLKHELAQLAEKVDWDWIDGEIAPLYSDKGRPGIETRFVIGLLLLKHIYGLSDEGVCERL